MESSQFGQRRREPCGLYALGNEKVTNAGKCPLAEVVVCIREKKSPRYFEMTFPTEA